MQTLPLYTHDEAHISHSHIRPVPKFAPTPVKEKVGSTTSEAPSLAFLQDGFSDSFKLLDSFFHLGTNEEPDLPEYLTSTAPDEEVPVQSGENDPEVHFSERYRNIMKWKKRLAGAKRKIEEARAERDMAQKMLEMLALEDQMSSGSGQGEQNPVGAHVQLHEHLLAKHRSAAVPSLHHSRSESTLKQASFKSDNSSPKHAQNPHLGQRSEKSEKFEVGIDYRAVHEDDKNRYWLF